MAVITILAASLLVAGSAMIDNAKSKSTRAVLGIVRDALEQFKEEQTAGPNLTRATAYQARYGFFPPDELEVFTPVGVPPPATLPGSRMVGGASVVPAPSGAGSTYGSMNFYVDGLTWAQQAEEHRELAAMILAIDTYCESADAIIDRISSSHRMAGPLDGDGNPAQFLDRNGNETFDAMVDEQILYIVDDWGVPITYFAQRDFDTGPASRPTDSGNHEHWNAASTAMIRANRGQPILCSYGPDGPEQLRQEIVIAAGSTATLVHDWADDGNINGPLNEDNVYPDQPLEETLSRLAP
jgi:type II secretory pathway pseudopilin PulG